jgi:hypothetical protein
VRTANRQDTEVGAAESSDGLDRSHKLSPLLVALATALLCQHE